MNRVKYTEVLRQLLLDPPKGFGVVANHMDDSGDHPESFVDYECAFAAHVLRSVGPKRVLDIGSYRHFILGLTSYSYDITSVDIRHREAMGPNEAGLVCDAGELLLAPEEFDAVVSLCSLEHFGLGRYGDDIDLEGDKKAFAEWVRVLKPGGSLIFSTTIGKPCICFNAHRIYSHGMIKSFCFGLELVNEQVYSKTLGLVEIGQEVDDLGRWDIYLGHWRKP